MDKWFTHDDPIQFLFLNDLLLAPIFLLVLFVFARSYVRKKKNPVYKKYFVAALAVRMASAILMALVYQYYYNGGGDTHTYFTYVLRIREIFYESKSAFFNFVFLPSPDDFLLEKYFGGVCLHRHVGLLVDPVHILLQTAFMAVLSLHWTDPLGVCLFFFS